MIFEEHQNIVTASAPGRLDVMGGIADYSGSWVLQMPIRERATVQAAFRTDNLLRVFSDDIGQVFTLKINELPLDYSEAKDFFKQKKGGDWAAYVLGCLLVLAKEKNQSLNRGVDFSVKSEVPIGKGVSSSAALEIATMRALAQLFPLDFQGTEMAVLAQKAENLVVGSPCGLMDQLASCFGQAGYLLPIQCQPDRLFPTVKLPDGMAFVGIDSGIRHAVGGASYGEVRTAAFMGLCIIEAVSGESFGGYLCNIPPSVFEKKYAMHLPEIMSGEAFLKKYGGTGDPVTSVEPGKIYRVKNCARHPVYENFRAQAFARLLQQPPENETLGLLGELMFQSHESYSSVGLSNAHTDEIVEMVRQAGIGRGVFGAKITGGGSGGTVCVGCFGEQGLATAKTIFEKYRAKHGFDIRFILT